MGNEHQRYVNSGVRWDCTQELALDVEVLILPRRLEKWYGSGQGFALARNRAGIFTMPAPPSSRFHFLDGLRGLAALYVVFYHEALNSDEAPGQFSRLMGAIHGVIYKGHFAVVIFIVLSGFSLMLPVVRSQRGELVGGLADFARRRARRILPPYYAALAFSLLAVASYYILEPVFHFSRPKVEHVFESGTIVSHLLLIHNLDFEWAYKINAPMWSVATEWQIYFLFALLLLPLWRRAGILGTVLFAWLIGCLPLALSPADNDFSWAGPWLLGCFSFGMLAAVISASPAFAESWWRRRAPWASLSIIAALLVVFLSKFDGLWIYIGVDAAVSLCAMCVINCCVRDAERGRRTNLLLRLFGSRTLVALGGFSYSLYLVQHPFLAAAKGVLNHLNVDRNANLLLELAFLTPLLLAVAWLFAQFFERPFTASTLRLPFSKQRARTPAEKLSEAPAQS